MKRGDIIEINSNDYWYKIVDFLQQNWALIDKTNNGVVIWFFGDAAGVFDQLEFNDKDGAIDALQRNGFKQFSKDHAAQKFIAIPDQPFRWRTHPNGPIYSSGRYWK